MVQEAGRGGVAAAALRPVRVGGFETGLGHELLNVAEEAHGVAVGAGEFVGLAVAVAAGGPAALDAGCFDALGCGFQGGLGVGAPGHPAQGSFRTFGEDQAVAVVVAPAAQVDVAVHAVDDAHAELFLVEPCRGFDVRGGDLEVGKMGEGSFHVEFLLSTDCLEWGRCRSSNQTEAREVFGEEAFTDATYLYGRYLTRQVPAITADRLICSASRVLGIR